MESAELSLNAIWKSKGVLLGALASFVARFLPTIAKTVLPTLGIGALAGLVSSIMQKVVVMVWIWKKVVAFVETDGKGVYLGPASRAGFELVGDGLYLKKGKKLYDSKGLILGPKSPLKNVHILVWIL